MDVFFHQNCRTLRKLKGWKQSEVKGFSTSTWGNYETGLSKPNFDDLIRISQIFGVTLDQLVFHDLQNSALFTATPGDENEKNLRSKVRTNPRSYDRDILHSTIAADSGLDGHKTGDKPLQQRVLGIENRLEKVEKLLKKIADKLT